MRQSDSDTETFAIKPAAPLSARIGSRRAAVEASLDKAYRDLGKRHIECGKNSVSVDTAVDICSQLLQERNALRDADAVINKLGGY